jgi:hypothetical protein
MTIIPHLRSFSAIIDLSPRTQFLRIYVGVFLSPTLEEYLLSTLAIILVRPVSFVLLGNSCLMDRSGAPCGAAETFSATRERVLCHAAGSVIVYFVHLDRRRAWIRERRRAAAEMRRKQRADAVAAAIAAIAAIADDETATAADYVAVTERGDALE